MNIILFLLIVVPTLGRRQLSLEDIEKDNIRSETESKYEPASHVVYSESYTVAPNDEESSTKQQNVYAPLSSHDNYNYEVKSEVYKDTMKYSDNDLTYQQSNAENNVPKNSYFDDIAKDDSQESKQLIEQQEITVGNHLQTEQQKLAGQKHGTNNKDAAYVTIPMDQLLTYYPYLGVGQINVKTRAQFAPHGAASVAPQHGSVRVYTPSFGQKLSYQIQPHSLSYPSPHPRYVYTQAIFPAMAPKSHYVSAKLRPHVSQSYPQYVQQVIYVKPGMVYTQGTPIYTDLYARAPAYTQDNSLYSQAQRSHQVYVSSAIAEQLAKHISEEPQINSITSHHKKIPGASILPFVPSQYRMQKLRSSVTQLLPVPTGNEVVSSKHYAALSHEPKSLLDTYIPSYVIAAHDSDRYKEKPIKLERGFLPSKVNFIQELKEHTNV